MRVATLSLIMLIVLGCVFSESDTNSKPVQISKSLSKAKNSNEVVFKYWLIDTLSNLDPEEALKKERIQLSYILDKDSLGLTITNEYWYSSCNSLKKETRVEQMIDFLRRNSEEPTGPYVLNFEESIYFYPSMINSKYEFVQKVEHFNVWLDSTIVIDYSVIRGRIDSKKIYSLKQDSLVLLDHLYGTRLEKRSPPVGASL